MQPRTRAIRDFRYEEIETSLVVATVGLPCPARCIPQHVSIHGIALAFHLCRPEGIIWSLGSDVTGAALRLEARCTALTVYPRTHNHRAWDAL